MTDHERDEIEALRLEFQTSRKEFWTALKWFVGAFAVLFTGAVFWSGIRSQQLTEAIAVNQAQNERLVDHASQLRVLDRAEASVASKLQSIDERLAELMLELRARRGPPWAQQQGGSE